jgi:hypothetical protein
VLLGFHFCVRCRRGRSWTSYQDPSLWFSCFDLCCRCSRWLCSWAAKSKARLFLVLTVSRGGFYVTPIRYLMKCLWGSEKPVGLIFGGRRFHLWLYLHLVMVSLYFHFSNPVLMANSLSIAMWSWLSYKRGASGWIWDICQVFIENFNWLPFNTPPPGHLLQSFKFE